MIETFNVGDVVKYQGAGFDSSLEGELGIVVSVDTSEQLFNIMFEKQGMRYSVHVSHLTLVRKFKWPTEVDLKKENYVRW